MSSPLLLAALAFAAENFDAWSFYFGDIHSHTGASRDGGSSDMGTCLDPEGQPASCGAFAEYGATARTNGLDFVGTVDHVNKTAGERPSRVDFENVLKAVNGLNEDGAFVTLPGAEVFFELEDGTELGHKSLLLFGDEATLATLELQDLQGSPMETSMVADCAAIATFMATLTATWGPALLIPHHPGAQKPMATDWTCHDASFGPLVEVYSEHGNSVREEDLEAGYDPLWSGYVPEGVAHAALDPDGHALQLGFAGGSDNHDTHPGQTCALDTVRTEHWYGGGLTVALIDPATTFTRAALHEAFAARRTYATSGPRVPAVVTYTTDGGATLGMGEALADWDPRTDGGLDVEVRLPASAAAAVVEVALVSPTDRVAMTADGNGGWTSRVDAAEVEPWYYAHVVLDTDVLWEEGCEDGQNENAGVDDRLDHLWLSPTFFGAGDPVDCDADDDGHDDALCGGDDCDDADATAFLGATEACDDGADDDCDGDADAADSDCVQDTGDTGDTADSGEGDSGADTDEADSGDEPPTSRCDGCTTGAGSPGSFLAALAALTLLRRRR